MIRDSQCTQWNLQSFRIYDIARFRSVLLFWIQHCWYGLNSNQFTQKDVTLLISCNYKRWNAERIQWRSEGVRRVRRPRASRRGHPFWCRPKRLQNLFLKSWCLAPDIQEPLHATQRIATKRHSTNRTICVGRIKRQQHMSLLTF